MSSASNTKNFFANNLLQLQNFIKRDASSYKDEVKKVNLLCFQLYFSFDSLTIFVYLT